MKKTLGLDIGTNSIGWAIVEIGEFGQQGSILGIGSRIIPMDGDAMQKFESGNPISKNADRRMSRMSRRLKQRFKLRRTRLITALKILEWIPIDFPTEFKTAIKKDPNYSFSINQYLPFEAQTILDAKKALQAQNIPEDWVIYYLRRKALREKISLVELARIIYMMNQRRGFKSSRKDKHLAEIEDKEVWIDKLIFEKVEEIKEEDTVKGKKKKFNIIAGQYSWEVQRNRKPEWEGQERFLKITKTTRRDGTINHSFTVPEEDDYLLMNEALKKDIKESGMFVGEYFFNKLVKDKNYRIRQNVVDRSLYKEEFEAIWAKQATFHPALNCTQQLPAIAGALYKNNQAKQKELISKNLLHLFINDIIYFQRPLKSQKHNISFCKYEVKNDSEGKTYGIRVAPKSSPEFQEFRIWQTIHNLRILIAEDELDEKTSINKDYSEKYLDTTTKTKLFELFDGRASVSHQAILKEIGLNNKKYKLNYPDIDFSGNETKAVFRKVFKKHQYLDKGEELLSNPIKMRKLWHILYSLENENDIASTLTNPKHAFNLPDEIIIHLSKIPSFPKQYAAYSSKAMHKLLSLMRCGKYFSLSNIQDHTLDRINKIINGEYDEGINDDLRNKIATFNLTDLSHFQGLPLWLSSYLIYGKNSERGNNIKYEGPDDIDIMKLIPYNSLKNPIVEQVIKECLSLVKDIWLQYGQPNEIHIELARALKTTAEERKKMDDRNKANEADKKRIRAILRELQYANPDSPSDMERIRLWEETGNEVAKNEAIKFSREPSRTEIEKYKLWGEQNHISPYTGKIIPLSKLFTSEYEIEHIIPRSRFFDNSFTNKTICESYVNDFKGNRIAKQLIEMDGGRIITHKGHTFSLFTMNEYLDHCKKTKFSNSKLRNFMRDDVPVDFIARQINDTRHITTKLSSLLYPIAKDKEGIVFTIGHITSELKDKWGLNRVWKEILKPRFERLEQITGASFIDYDNTNNNIHLKKDYKRVDHRHHALDALVIACTSRQHIMYLNTLNSSKDDTSYKYLVKKRYSDFVLPWETFTKEVKVALQQIIVSHKNRNRLLSNAINKYTKWVQKPDGQWIKELVRQTKGRTLAIRKSMFKEPLGQITLREYKEVNLKQAITIQLKAIQNSDKKNISQIADPVYRKQINELLKNCAYNLSDAEKFLKIHPLKDQENNTIKKLFITIAIQYASKRVAFHDKITHEWIDSNIPYAPKSYLSILLHNHLSSYSDNSKEAFTGEGLDILFKKHGGNINKITRKESGDKINLNGKLFEGDKGTNLFFVIYEHRDTKERIIDKNSTIPLLEALEKLANKWPIATAQPEYTAIVLSPNDLVYVPEDGEETSTIDWSAKKLSMNDRIYKVVSFSKAQCFFVPHFVSRPLDDTGKELGANNKSERAWDNQMIKDVCIKIKVDRLGNITEAMGKNQI